MADLIKKIKIKKQDGTFSDYIPIGADAENVNMQNNYSVEENIGDIDFNNKGSIAEQLNAKDSYLKNINERISFDRGQDLNTLLKNGKLIFYDDFDGNNLDLNKWIYRYGFVSNEPQCYTDKSDNVWLEDSNLVLNLKKEDYTHGGKLYHYTSGRVETKGKYEFTKGTGKVFEARVKMEQGAGYFPAFWLAATMTPPEIAEYLKNSIPSSLSTAWPFGGEVDFFEYWDVANSFQSACHWSAKYYPEDPISWRKRFYITNHTPLDVTEWHTYGCVWNDDHIDYYCDGEIIWTVYTGHITDVCTENMNPFLSDYAPKTIILNVAAKTATVPSATWDSIKMLVDYVKVYEIGGEEVAPTSIETPYEEINLDINQKFIANGYVNKEATNKAVIIEIADENIVTMTDNYPVIKGVAQGTTTITFSTPDGSVSKVIPVTVGGN